jgi:hypothetical protein
MMITPAQNGFFAPAAGFSSYYSTLSIHNKSNLFPTVVVHTSNRPEHVVMDDAERYIEKRQRTAGIKVA